MAATPQNIKVRHRYGESDFLLMIDQIILLTHIHGSSLFRSTRLPAPVHHSHNFATLLQKQDLNAISLMDRLCPIYL
jgi:argonaute-like protein implicated in RNA metabolism and viral defense